MLYTSWLLHTTVQFQDHSLRVWGGAEGSSVKACIGEPVQRPHCLIRGSVRGDPLPGGRSLRWTCVWLLVPTWGPFRTSRVLPQDSPLSLSWLPSCWSSPACMGLYLASRAVTGSFLLWGFMTLLKCCIWREVRQPWCGLTVCLRGDRRICFLSWREFCDCILGSVCSHGSARSYDWGCCFPRVAGRLFFLSTWTLEFCITNLESYLTHCYSK